MNNPKVINLEGDSVEFKREWRNGRYRLVAEVYATTPKNKTALVKIKFDFDCLEWIVPQLRTVWNKELEERNQRNGRIHRAVN